MRGWDKSRPPVARGPRKTIAPIGDVSDRRSLEFHIGEFLEWTAVRGFSDSTVATRKRELDRFHRWLIDRGVTRTAEVTKPMLDRYQRWLFHYRKANGQPLTFLTQRGRLMPLRAFFSWCTKTNRILFNPASDIEMPKVEQRLPANVLTAVEVETVMCQPDIEDPFGLRDRAILELFYATGIRRAEMGRIGLFDLDVNRRALSIRQGKNKKDRMVPVTERAMAWVLAYLTDTRPRLVLEPDDGFLFLGFDGEPLSPNYLTVICSRYVSLADVGKTGACHLFRHSMATLLLEGGADIRFIQAMLGHANLSTTQVYTRVSITQLAKIIDACLPGARNETTRNPQLDADETGGRSLDAAELLAALDAETEDDDTAGEPPDTGQEQAS